MGRPQKIKNGKKVCPMCETEKDISDFGFRSGNQSHLLKPFCKECHKQYSNKKNKEKDYRERENKRRRESQEYKEKSNKWRAEYRKTHPRDEEISKSMIRQRERIAQNPEKEKAARKQAREKLRKEFIAAYGGRCECCGETRYEFLTIEHKNGDGAQERKHTPSHVLLARLRREGWPDKHRYGVLCWNCNSSRGAHGYCPHERERQNH